MSSIQRYSNSKQSFGANWVPFVGFFYRRTWLFLCLAGLFSLSSAQAKNEEATPTGLPSIGKFMLDKDKTSTWPQASGGKKTQIDEPINVIVRVHAPNRTQATALLMRAMVTAGFGPASGHTGGYTALINGHIYHQISTGDGQTFSDASFMTTNDHCRFFGPMFWSKDGNYYFAGDVSRETPNYQNLAQYGNTYFHSYVSFAQARKNLSDALESRAGARNFGMIRLGNTLKINAESTGDHDGSAVLLELQ